MKDGRPQISHDTFDVEFANRLAQLESFNKHLYRPNSYLHKWWARRCGTTFRLILKSLAGAASDRDYYAPGGLQGKIVLDPMLGGGTTLHEAIRLGANVAGFDVDPIPVLQARATLSDTPLEELELGFKTILEALEARLAPLYLTRCSYCSKTHPVRFVMYALRQRCECGEALFVDSLIIRRGRDGSVVRLCETCHQPTSGFAHNDCVRGGRLRLYQKQLKRCPVCRARFRQLLELPYFRRYYPLAVALDCRNQDAPTGGLQFQAVGDFDRALLDQADTLRPKLKFGATTCVNRGPKSEDLIRREIKDYRDLFTSRQLLYLETAIGAMADLETSVRTHLALLLSTSLEFNVLLCGYKGSGVRRAGAVRHAFSHHAYSFPYIAVENNPVYDRLTSGTLRQLFRDRVTRARLWAQEPRERVLDGAAHRFVAIRGEVDSGQEVVDVRQLEQGTQRFYVRQGSAADMPLVDGSVDMVITDPPYFDSVQYGNLSEFFRVWLRQLVDARVAEELRWTYSMSESAVDGGGDNVDGHYLEIMAAIFGECRRVLKPQTGRLAFTFHHWKAAGWGAICVALKRSKFQLEAYYIVHSENPTSVHIANMNALSDDAILVLAPETAGVAPLWRQPEAIDSGTSAAFCRDCAEGVGWTLASDLDEEEIGAWWVRRLGRQAGRDNKRPL